MKKFMVSRFGKFLVFALLINIFPGCTWFSASDVKSSNGHSNVFEPKTVAEFNELIKKDKVLVDWFANWCGPCGVMLPYIYQVAAEEGFEDVTFVKANTDLLGSEAQKFRVNSIPTLMCFSEGKKVGDRKIGLSSADEIKEFIKKNFS